LNSIVGFTASLGLDPAARERRDRAQSRALGHFPWLTLRTLRVGEAEVQLWGHGSPDEFIVELEDGGLFVVAGAPVGEFSPQAVRESLASAERAEDFELPWDGRLTALCVSGDGRRWAAWDDWTGSIPLFHARSGKGRVASTLEPAVVAACGFTPADFSPPSLLSLLVHGHYLGDWTLFRDMHVLPPDSAAEWDGEGGFRSARQWTIRATQERWESGWDELIDEMHALFRRALSDALKPHPSWTLPLSGGLDSRLIAAVGKDVGVEFRAYTYGEMDAIEAIHAREVAKRLRIPWQHVPIPPDYLARHTETWLEWFGSALHCHGMYQMPLLEAVRGVDLPIVTGFTGDPLGGAQTKKMMGGPADRSMLDRLMDKWHLCTLAEAEALMGERFTPALEEMRAELERQEREVEGSLYQRAWIIFQWNHVFGFSYYQPLMYDYWKGVGTPFVNRSLVNFCLSLPRCALDHRRLQKEMLLRHFPEMASVGGTFGDRVAASPGYIVKRRIAERLPYRLRKGPLQEFGPNWTNTEARALAERGQESLWPLDRVRGRLGEWLDTDVLDDLYRRAAAGDSHAYDQLRGVQAVAWHFVSADGAQAPHQESQARAAL
jgi:hypothetical protein